VSTKWHAIDQAAASQLTQLTSSPGVVVPLSTSALPASLQGMPGAVSYFASSYVTQVTAPGIAIGGEMVVVRTDQATAKAYNFIFATSSHGQVCFAGPFKNFPAHHSPREQPAAVAAMFGHARHGNK